MKDATFITVILDRTGSMQSIKTDVIGGFNQFLREQQVVPGECRLTLVQFDSQDSYEVVRDNLPIKEVPPLDDATYQPRANTPLYDAVGRGIVNTGDVLSKMSDGDRPDKVIFVIITDGMENASREYKREKVLEMIQHQTKEYNWQFVYLGANQDAMKEGAAIGVSPMMAMDFAANSAGVRAAYSASSSNVAQYRAGTKKDLNWTAQQRQEQENLKASSH